MVSYLKTHLFYIIVIAIGVVSFRTWLSEHDARVQAENAAKQAQVNIVSLQKQIDAIPAQTAASVAKVRTIVAKTGTPSQVVAAIPLLTDVPLATRAIPGNTTDVEVAAVPLVTLVGELKTSQIELGACQQTDALKDKQLAAKDVEIAALKKKPKFLIRVKHVAEAVGVGIAIGVLLVK